MLLCITKIGPTSLRGIICSIPKGFARWIKEQKEEITSVGTPLFRSPLSRMLLLPRIQRPRTQIAIVSH
ncbi:hypothetical protein BS78_01G273500 [Paspalum vaginatum]|nr:hypothetical protein BS78_01G273500 [Paspalum vaginatum]